MARRRAKRTTGALAVVGYIRCSTSKQDLSPAAQASAIDRWAASEGAELVAVFVDVGISGASDVADRPGLVAALGYIQDHAVGALLAAKRDRLARDVGVAASIERLAQRADARVLCADGGNGEDDALRRGIEDLMSAEELRRIRRRTRDALAVKKARGELTGQPPYGWQVANPRTHPDDPAPRLERNEPEQRCLTRARALDEAGLSYQKIADALTAEGFRNRTGRPWNKQRMCKLLASST